MCFHEGATHCHNSQHTFGCHGSVVHRCSSTASTSNEPGPDVADYPYDTVPNKAGNIAGKSLGLRA